MRIILSLLLSVAATFAAYTDAFPYNSGALSADWQLLTGGACAWVTTIGDEAAQTGGDECMAQIKTSVRTFNADQYSQVRASHGINYAGIVCRGSGTTLSNQNGYHIYENDSGFYKWVSGTRSTLTGTWSASTVQDDNVKLTCTGSSTVTLTAYINGVSQGSASDSSSPLTSGQPGIIAYNWFVDDFEADDIGGGGPSFPVGIIPNIPVRCCGLAKWFNHVK